jgi:hypothetical protein
MILPLPGSSGAVPAKTRLSRRNSRDALCLAGLLLFASTVLLLGAMGEGSVVSSVSVAGMLLAGGLGLLALERGSLSTRVAVRWFVIAYSLRVGFAVLVHVAAITLDQLPFLFHDEPSFYGYAERLLAAWRNGTIARQSPVWYQRDYWAWLHIVGFIRFVGDLLGGDTALNVKLVNCAAGALIVPYVYGLTHTVFDRKTARVAAGLAFLLPDYWVLSATLLRDVFVSFAIVLVLYQVLMLVHGRFRWWRLAFACLVNFGVLMYLRSYVAVIVAGIAVGCVLWDCSRRWPAYRFVPLLLGTGVMLLLLFAVLTVVIPADSYQNPRNLLEVHRLLSRGTDRYTDLAVREASEDSLGARLLELPIYVRVPISAVRLVLLPIPPWGAFQFSIHYNFTRALLETVAACAWYLLLPVLAVGAVGMLRDRQAPAVWIWAPAAVFILVLAINTGFTARWRLMPMPFLLILIARGWILKARYRQVAGLTVLVLILMLASYMLIKYLYVPVGIPGMLAVVIPALLISIVIALRNWACTTARSSPGRDPISPRSWLP